MDMIIFYSLIGLAGLVTIFIVLTIVAICKLNKISKNSKNGNIADTIENYYTKVEQLTTGVHALSNRFEDYEKGLANSFKKTAVVRYNAYGDISGNMSFSAAFLNDHNDGFVLTSLYGHETCNVYLREVKNGMPLVTIAIEEKQAIDEAIALRGKE